MNETISDRSPIDLRDTGELKIATCVPAMRLSYPRTSGSDIRWPIRSLFPPERASAMPGHRLERGGGGGYF